jgi:hypothetical protein
MKVMQVFLGIVRKYVTDPAPVLFWIEKFKIVLLLGFLRLFGIFVTGRGT